MLKLERPVDPERSAACNQRAIVDPLAVDRDHGRTVFAGSGSGCPHERSELVRDGPVALLGGSDPRLILAIYAQVLPAKLDGNGSTTLGDDGPA
jgi:hypothetical protein